MITPEVPEPVRIQVHKELAGKYDVEKEIQHVKNGGRLLLPVLCLDGVRQKIQADENSHHDLNKATAVPGNDNIVKLAEYLWLTPKITILSQVFEI